MHILTLHLLCFLYSCAKEKNPLELKRIFTLNLFVLFNYVWIIMTSKNASRHCIGLFLFLTCIIQELKENLLSFEQSSSS